MTLTYNLVDGNILEIYEVAEGQEYPCITSSFPSSGNNFALKEIARDLLADGFEIQEWYEPSRNRYNILFKKRIGYKRYGVIIPFSMEFLETTDVNTVQIMKKYLERTYYPIFINTLLGPNDTACTFDIDGSIINGNIG